VREMSATDKLSKEPEYRNHAKHRNNRRRRFGKRPDGPEKALRSPHGRDEEGTGQDRGAKKGAGIQEGNPPCPPENR